MSAEIPPTASGIAMLIINDFRFMFEVIVKKTTPFSIFILKDVVFILYKTMSIT